MSVTGLDAEDDPTYTPDTKYDEEDRPSDWAVGSDGTPSEAKPDILAEMMDVGDKAGHDLVELLEERTVDVLEDLDEDHFFKEGEGESATTTIVTRYDLEKEVPLDKKAHFKEIDRYWLNKPFAFCSLFRSTKENEIKYYVIEPYRNPIEEEISDFFSKKLRTVIKYDSGDIAVNGTEEERKRVIEEKTRTLLDRYNLYDPSDFKADIGDNDSGGFLESIKSILGRGDGGGSSSLLSDKRVDVRVRPEPALLEDNSATLNGRQVQKLIYYLKRDFIGFERIDPVKYDINVEDISCDGYNEPVFMYHGEHEQIISNIVHGDTQLDEFVVKLAQRSGKGISKREPQVDATLPDGSRAQLTLGSEVSGKGTNYTIRQFKDVPFTPVDLICWKTFGLREMAFLWLAIENNKSMIFAGGTASGKTTSLNAVSLFIPSSEKIVSIEDTREVELPQRNWVASVTRPSFSGEKGEIDEFALLEAALRQRPDYIVMGEIRGEEGRTLFQVMSTGHTTYTTFHADSVGEVLKRFTTDPINVSKTLFTALDLVSIQTATRVNGNKVRRNENLTEINHYDAENDEINVQDIYEWQPADDKFVGLGEDGTVRGTSTYEEIMFNRGWEPDEAWEEIRKRELVLAYLIEEELRTYSQVAATIQAFINDQETILTLMANDVLDERLEDLRDMESVLIDIDPEDEEHVPRPDPADDVREKVDKIMEEYDDILQDYVHKDPDTVFMEDSLPTEEDIEPEDEPEEDEIKGIEANQGESEGDDDSDSSLFQSGPDEPDEDDFEPV